MKSDIYEGFLLFRTFETEKLIRYNRARCIRVLLYNSVTVLLTTPLPFYLVIIRY